MYAIIEDSGAQIRTRVGDMLTIDRRDLPQNTDSITFDRVLMVGDADAGSHQIGEPYVAGASVVADVLENDAKGEKIDVIKFKRRKGYLRKQGHRQRYMKVRVKEINRG